MRRQRYGSIMGEHRDCAQRTWHTECQLTSWNRHGCLPCWKKSQGSSAVRGLQAQWSCLVSHRTAGTEDRDVWRLRALASARSVEPPQLLLPLLEGGERWWLVSLRVAGAKAGRCRAWSLHGSCIQTPYLASRSPRIWATAGYGRSVFVDGPVFMAL